MDTEQLYLTDEQLERQEILHEINVHANPLYPGNICQKEENNEHEGKVAI